MTNENNQNSNNTNTTSNDRETAVENWLNVVLTRGRVGSTAWSDVTREDLERDFHRSNSGVSHYSLWRGLRSHGFKPFESTVPSLDECRGTLSNDLTSELEQGFRPSNELSQ